MVAVRLPFCEPALHPRAVAIAPLYLFDIQPYAARVMIAAALSVAVPAWCRGQYRQWS